MSVPHPLEHNYLAGVEEILRARLSALGCRRSHARLDVLEAAASRLGGWDLDEYRVRLESDYVLDTSDALAIAGPVLQALTATPLPGPLALSSLARPDLSAHAQRKNGVYYTDFRLATHLAEGLARHISPGCLTVDVAAGTGILLTATVLAVCGDDRLERARMLRDSVCAADLSPDALRGARLALASLTDDVDVVSELTTRMRVQDSLIVGSDGWSDVAPNGFAAVVGNPPWEKIKVSRHEFLRAAGTDRHYGDDYAFAGSETALGAHRAKAARYALTLTEKYPLSGAGEADLYKAFFELGMQLASPSGRVALIVPAGLIRSQGTKELRRLLLEAGQVDVTILENRARFFAIDSRFKFLIVQAGLGARKEPTLALRHASGTESGVEEYGTAKLGRRQLPAVRPDLTMPEVRSSKEWRLFQRMSEAGSALGATDGCWRPRIVREVDMTRDRKKFCRIPGEGRLPLLEGRMVHQFRSGAKSYVEGTGRRAIWEPNPMGLSETTPQFWIAETDLPASARGRAALSRVGFCDVTGQTNERTILATRIPTGLVCGNKVPTMTFRGAAEGDEAAMDLWVGIANSFAFDWLARRVVTTTVNFFLLLSLPFPDIQPGGLPARRIASVARELDALDRAGAAHPWQVAEMRATIDARVAVAYGLELDAVELILADFPLLDRGQPPIAGEATSTITRDLVLMRTSHLLGACDERYSSRVGEGRRVGAVPYVPAQYAGVVDRTGIAEAT